MCIELILTWLSTPSFPSVHNTHTFSNTHTHRAHPYNSAISSPWGLQDCLECVCVCACVYVLGLGKRKRFCVSCTLLSQALTCQFHLYLFESVEVWHSSSIFFHCCLFPPILHSSHVVIHLQHSGSAHSLSVRHFRQTFTKCQETKKPGWQTKTLHIELWNVLLANLGTLVDFFLSSQRGRIELKRHKS